LTAEGDGGAWLCAAGALLVEGPVVGAPVMASIASVTG
jgi:hypothetical protein